MWFDLSKKVPWLIAVMGSCFLSIFFVTLIANYFNIKIYHDSPWGIIKTFIVLFFLPGYVGYKSMFILGYIKEQSEVNIYAENFWGFSPITIFLPAFLGGMFANSIYKELKNKSNEQAHYEQPQYNYVPPQPIEPTLKPFDGNLDNEQGKNSLSPTLICGDKAGYSAKGLNFYGPLTYKLSPNNPARTEIKWGVKYDYAYMQDNSHTGSLRVRLYAISKPYFGGDLDGYVIGEYYPNFSGTGAVSNNQLKINYNVENIISTDSRNISMPAGQYCTVLTLEEFDKPPTCLGVDGYCIQSWMQFKDPVTF